MHKVLGQDLHKMSFHTKEEKPRTHQCMSYGEEASAFSCDKMTPSEVATFFRCFYNGFTQEKIVWYAYYGENNTFELPVKFNFKPIDTNADSMTSFEEAIIPGILPINFFTGRSHQPSYEFYYTSVGAR
jgi:hypothetical protein